MSILNGGSGKRAVTQMTDSEYLNLFIAGITDTEWTYLRHLPPITRRTQLAILLFGVFREHLQLVDRARSRGVAIYRYLGLGV